MSADVTAEDLAAAEHALRDIWFENGKKPRDMSGGAAVVAQAIADARVAGAKEEREREGYHSRRHLSRALTWIAQNLKRNQCSGIALVARALLAADEDRSLEFVP